ALQRAVETRRVEQAIGYRRSAVAKSNARLALAGFDQRHGAKRRSVIEAEPPGKAIERLGAHRVARREIGPGRRRRGIGRGNATACVRSPAFVAQSRAT